MPSCQATITNSRGDVVTCRKETAKHDSNCCYYHSKVMQGLCAPVEYAEDSIVDMGDRVISIKVGNHERTFGQTGKDGK